MQLCLQSSPILAKAQPSIERSFPSSSGDVNRDRDDLRSPKRPEPGTARR
jgi:hypothetical protein